ncbi:DsbE family thiol:disulfide interchange protein [Pelagibacterales bacterium SAG-MED13]|nr:DsbE family thiol:disulfide interchange protein [Pelagibacterales bacterium SAG-MED13]
MNIKILPTILILFFCLIFLIFYKGLKNSNIYTPQSYLEIDVPVFVLKSFKKEDEINSKDIFKHDQFYLLNIWASWCVPCRAEHEFLMMLNNNKKIKIIGLNYKDKFDNAKNFIEEMGNPYFINLIDKNGTAAIDWGAYGVPESFLIYQNKVIKKYLGPLNDKSYFEIEEIIK